MARAHRTFAASLAASALALAFAVPAHAGPKEAAKLDKAAMDDDYLNVRFDKAEEKLRKALKECDKGCDAKQKSSIYMHLGIILVNAGKKDDAVGAFADGLKQDSSAAPEKDFTSPDVQKAYDEAKNKGGGKAPKDDGDKPSTDKPEPSSDLKHEAVTEAQVNTPLPISVGADASAAKFVLNYKPFGGEWTKLEMKKMGKIYGAEIPCKDTSQTGSLKYYIVAQDAGGDTVASAGSKKQPYEVAVKNKVADVPSFPGKDPPSQCKSKDQCPPGINEPGCESTAALGFGSKCTGPGQCNKADGLACVEGTCQAGSEEGGDAGGDGGGDGDAAPPKKNWLSFSIALDEAIVGGGEVCSPDNEVNTGIYTCFKGDGSLYKPYNTGTTATGTKFTPDHGTVSGPPFAVGTPRVLAGYDRLIVSNLLIGVRVGYAFGGAPEGGNKSFMPFHFEPRLTYFFGKNVLAKTGVRPYVFVSGGLAEVDAKISGVPVSNDNPQAKKDISVDAWRKMGTSFGAIGGGIVYAVNHTTGISLDIKISQFFGTSGNAVTPALGVVKGF